MAKRKDNEGQAKDIVRRIYEEFLGRPSQFNLDDFEKRALKDCRKFLRKLYGTAIHKLCKDVDDEYGKKREHPALPGMEDVDLGGRYNCGNNVRIAKRHATWNHYLLALEIVDKETDREIRKREAMRTDGNKMKEYWDIVANGKMRTKEEAWEAYCRDHPEQFPEVS